MSPKQKTPTHVAIIMDGNGRWARQKGLPRIAGHRAGVETVREAVKAAIEMKIPVLTLYAFSQENWKRPKEEVSMLMGLLDLFLRKELDELRREGVRLHVIGRLEGLPANIARQLTQAATATRANDRLVLNLALNYGSRQEILDAVARLLEEVRRDPSAFGDPAALTEELFSSYLYTHGLPDPDLLIRTSGEMRLSNFLLWQLSYAEIYITKKFWPDFRREDFRKAVRAYAKRERRFGDVRA